MARRQKKQQAEAPENSERWLVSYADFITLLLGFFIILYSMSNADTEKYQKLAASLNGAFSGSQYLLEGFLGESLIEGFAGDSQTAGESPTEENIGDGQEEGGLGEDIGGLGAAGIEALSMAQMKSDIEALASELNLGDSIVVVIDDLGIHIRIKDTVLFDSAKATINPSAEPIMEKIGMIIRALPNNYLRVEGHTDNLPINNSQFASNWELGANRATNVTKLLIKKCGITPTKITALSHGEFRPIATNKTAEGRAQNRRVEILILRKSMSGLEG